MKVTYVGDNNLPPEQIEIMGYKFKLNQSIDVKEEEKLKRFRRLKTFKVARNTTNELGLTQEEIKKIIVANKLQLKDKKISTAIAAVKQFLLKNK